MSTFVIGNLKATRDALKTIAALVKRYKLDMFFTMNMTTTMRKFCIPLLYSTWIDEYLTGPKSNPEFLLRSYTIDLRHPSPLTRSSLLYEHVQNWEMYVDALPSLTNCYSGINDIVKYAESLQKLLDLRHGGGKNNLSTAYLSSVLIYWHLGPARRGVAFIPPTITPLRCSFNYPLPDPPSSVATEVQAVVHNLLPILQESHLEPKATTLN